MERITKPSNVGYCKHALPKAVCEFCRKEKLEAEKDGEEQVYCERCGDTGQIEVMGDGVNFEWDVIGYKPCPDCQFED